MSRYRVAGAAAYVVVATAVLAWWIKGDLEMGWLIGAPMLVAGAGLAGLSTAFLFRRLIPVLIAAGASVALGIALVLVAIQTPNGWRVGPPCGMVGAATGFSRDSAAVERSAGRVTGLPVELMEATVDVQPGWVSKEGFSFSLRRRPATVAVLATFAAGPAHSLTFDISGRDGKWVPVARPATGDGRITFRQAAFQRRFPLAPLVEVGGQGPHEPGELLLVRAARSATDTELVLFRVASNGRVLDEVQRVGPAEIAGRFGGLVAERGLGRLGQVSIYFRPAGEYPVLFLNAPEFRFFGNLNHPVYGSVALFARLREGQVQFEIERAFPRIRGRSLADEPRRR